MHVRLFHSLELPLWRPAGCVRRTKIKDPRSCKLERACMRGGIATAATRQVWAKAQVLLTLTRALSTDPLHSSISAVRR